MCDENAIAPSILAESKNASGPCFCHFFLRAKLREQTLLFPIQKMEIQQTKKRNSTMERAMQWVIPETLPNFAYSILLYTSSQTAGHAQIDQL